MSQIRLGWGAALCGLVLMAGCIEVPTGAEDTSTAGMPVAPPPTKIETKAAELRQGLDSLLEEHVMLMASATDAALSGRTDDFTAANNALDDNTRELEGAVRTIYGEEAGQQFYDSWHTHVGYLVEYTQAVAANDDAAKTKALNEMLAYATDFGTWLQTVSGGRLTRDTVADLLRSNMAGVKGVIDAQAAKDYALAYTDERDAVKQSFILGNTWANAIVQQFPERY
jgi:hypothetical protein